jgi:isocitrate dehydrogenase
MMKISDPVMFGHAVSVYFADVFEKHGDVLSEVGANVNNGFADVVARLDRLPAEKHAEIEADIQACYERGPDLAMVDSDKGITNLHVPSDVIIDASMPA